MTQPFEIARKFFVFNGRAIHCERSALPTELHPQSLENIIIIERRRDFRQIK